MLEYEKRIVGSRVIGMEGAKTPMGDAGNLRPRRLAEEAQGHAPWKAKYLEWKSTFFFNKPN
ncbi:hypothetical protein GCM10007380_33620 [Gottfriedia solisilvae]|uniref:Uncharacterized protein n=1 Tax=Gottfriedia solisilvae TaxID=1516104 RepID=A0A8J3AML9_9BACI|nr:hypothetical protein GCM10007380_33620 [Gottfriedia solisilvae]